eukprot:SAG11_NODE_3472_length_2427_cov_1.326890_2_plen_316_part_01
MSQNLLSALQNDQTFLQLCECESEAGVLTECEVDWIQKRTLPLIQGFIGLLVFQTFLGYIAWVILEDPEEMARALENTKQSFVHIKDFSKKGMSDKWAEIKKLASGVDKEARIRKQAMTILDSVYYEISIIISVAIAMVVLAMQSKADPPVGDLGLTLRVCEIFVTVYLSVELLLEFTVAMTRMRQLQFLRSFWTWIDILVLVVSWMYLAAPDEKVVGIARVLRILRPIRSLRLFHSVGVIGECFADNMKAFVEVTVFTVFVLFLLALVGLHLFNGSIGTECLPPEISQENVTALDKNWFVLWEGRNISVQEYCPS